MPPWLNLKCQTLLPVSVLFFQISLLELIGTSNFIQIGYFYQLQISISPAIASFLWSSVMSTLACVSAFDIEYAGPPPHHLAFVLPQTHSCSSFQHNSLLAAEKSRCFLNSARLSIAVAVATTKSVILAQLQGAVTGNDNGEKGTSPEMEQLNGMKRKRGRPKGSKNKKKVEKPEPTKENNSSHSSIYDDEDSFDDDDDDDSEFTLRAPNGLPSGPPDLLQELLPIMAQQEISQLQDDNKDEKAMRELLSEAMTGIFKRSSESPRLDNLRPYKLRQKPIVCDACDGSGMVTCSYCKGEGMVDFGVDAHKFYKEFGASDMTLPKRVMGNTYLCPFCGCLTEERCEKCLGSGELEVDGQERQPYAAREDYRNHVWSEINMEQVLAEQEGEIEYGYDGLIVVRAKTRKGKGGRKPKKKPEEEKVESGVKGAVLETTDPLQKKKRGRPPKKTKEAATSQPVGDSPLISDTRSLVTSKDAKVREVKQHAHGPSTDFVNTTDYRVGRRLRGRKTILSDPFENGYIVSSNSSLESNENGDNDNGDAE